MSEESSPPMSAIERLRAKRAALAAAATTPDMRETPKPENILERLRARRAAIREEDMSAKQKEGEAAFHKAEASGHLPPKGPESPEKIAAREALIEKTIKKIKATRSAAKKEKLEEQLERYREYLREAKL